MDNFTPKSRLKTFCNKNKLVINGLAYAVFILWTGGVFTEALSYSSMMSILILALGSGFLASWVQVKYPSKRCAR